MKVEDKTLGVLRLGKRDEAKKKIAEEQQRLLLSMLKRFLSSWIVFKCQPQPLCCMATLRIGGNHRCIVCITECFHYMRHCKSW